MILPILFSMAASVASAAPKIIHADLPLPSTPRPGRSLGKVDDISWLPRPNVAEWIEATSLPPEDVTTAAYVIAYREGKVLIARHRTRGWDIPGGHIESGDTPAVTAVRETVEETGARITKLEMIAHQKLFIFAPKPAGWEYPYPESYQILYLAEVTDLGRFVEEEDMVERAFLPCEDALARVDWIREAPRLFDEIVARVDGASKE